MEKVGRKKNFHWGQFTPSKVKKVGQLRMGGHATRLPKYFPLAPQACKGAGDRQKQVWQRLTPQVGNEQMGNDEAPHSL